MDNILIKTSMLVLLLVLVAGLSLTVGLLVPRGHEVVKEQVKVDICLNPCSECINEIVDMRGALDDITTDAQRTSWCLQDNNWRLSECQK